MVRFRVSLLALCSVFLVTSAAPDSAGHAPTPGPGLTYGGIPYGSVSGNVAEFFSNRAPSSVRSGNFIAEHSGNSVDFAPIEQYLR